MSALEPMGYLEEARARLMEAVDAFARDAGCYPNMVMVGRVLAAGLNGMVARLDEERLGDVGWRRRNGPDDWRWMGMVVGSLDEDTERLEVAALSRYAIRRAGGAEDLARTLREIGARAGRQGDVWAVDKVLDALGPRILAREEGAA